MVSTVSVAASIPARIVTVRASGPANMAPVSCNVRLTSKSTAGAGAARSVNCSAIPSTTGLVPASRVTTGTGAPGARPPEHPESDNQDD